MSLQSSHSPHHTTCILNILFYTFVQDITWSFIPHITTLTRHVVSQFLQSCTSSYHPMCVHRITFYQHIAILITTHPLWLATMHNNMNLLCHHHSYHLSCQSISTTEPVNSEILIVHSSLQC
jgi:hypothetical protein